MSRLSDDIAGLCTAVQAASPQRDKRDVLAKMEKTAIDWWPVVNQGKLEGSVERARLISSLVLDVTEQLRGAETASLRPI